MKFRHLPAAAGPVRRVARGVHVRSLFSFARELELQLSFNVQVAARSLCPQTPGPSGLFGTTTLVPFYYMYMCPCVCEYLNCVSFLRLYTAVVCMGFLLQKHATCD